MKNKQYLIFTNIPSFYKVNLYNEIAKYADVKVVFAARTSSSRNADFYKGKKNFEYTYITDGDYETRNKAISFLKLISIFFKNSFDIVIFPGWEQLELFPFMFLFKKKHKAMIIESSINETKKSGFLWFIKRTLINQVGICFPSGGLQNSILEKAGFKGRAVKTHGVGIINRLAERINEEKPLRKKLRYLYIGRIIEKKNVENLIDTFNTLNAELTLIGEGELMKPLQDKAKSNINFVGHVDNKKLPQFFKEHDVFILPSKAEPWGLVVDEAIYFGLPVIVSDQVGCSEDLVELPNSGVIFSISDPDGIKNSVLLMEKNFTLYTSNVSKIDMESQINSQVQAYVKTLYSI